MISSLWLVIRVYGAAQVVVIKKLSYLCVSNTPARRQLANEKSGVEEMLQRGELTEWIGRKPI